MKPITLIFLSLALCAFAASWLAGPVSAQNPMTLVGQYDGEGGEYSEFGKGTTMGDFDADGKEEFVIGAPGWDQDRGKNYFYQYENDWPTAPYMTVQGEQQHITYDWSDANLGDINGDGLPDLGIPASSEEGGLDIGRLDLYFGSPSFDTLPDWSMHSIDTIITFADDLDSAGDVNGDGENDMVMLNWYIDNPGYTQTLEIFYGGQALDSIPDCSIIIDFCNISALGDVNADGYADVMTLDYNNQPAQIYFGGDPMDTIPDLIFEEYAYWGMGGGVGDVNGDGHPDFLLDMHWPDSTFGNDAVYFGGPDVDNVPDVHLLNWQGGLNGSSGMCSGDFNGDGFSDIVSTSGTPSLGRIVEIYLGGPWFNPVPDALLQGWEYYEFGETLASGDVNGDGRDELLVSAINYPSFHIGRVYLFEGPETWIDLGAGVEPEELQHYPGWFKLEQNYPNPFNSTTSIHFEIGKPSTVNIAIYDLRGQRIKELIAEKEMLPGGYNVSWSGKNQQNKEVSSGIYILELKVDQYQQILKMVLLR